jgi:hypothetical protein
LVNAGKLRLENSDPFLKLGDRQRVKILPDQLRQRIIRSLGEQFVEVHAIQMRRPPAICQYGLEGRGTSAQILEPKPTRKTQRADALNHGNGAERA